ncbi:MAG: hypothetical protein Q7S92_05305 [Candidatus Diapherotrites archaeon]|nr:hypothetical protein [Candidatus Diapherotrites archaeon]
MSEYEFLDEKTALKRGIRIVRTLPKGQLIVLAQGDHALGHVEFEAMNPKSIRIGYVNSRVNTDFFHEFRKTPAEAVMEELLIRHGHNEGIHLHASKLLTAGKKLVENFAKKGMIQIQSATEIFVKPTTIWQLKQQKTGLTPSARILKFPRKPGHTLKRKPLEKPRIHLAR